ncbi:MAG: hypothetical protein KAJ08_15345, partial [Deltaproteobacteria bacterium]|nr:hypothetical protein [Deltaproteobacteria bacterium]
GISLTTQHGILARNVLSSKTLDSGFVIGLKVLVVNPSSGSFIRGKYYNYNLNNVAQVRR